MHSHKASFAHSAVEHGEDSDDQVITLQAVLNALIVKLIKRAIKAGLAENAQFQRCFVHVGIILLHALFVGLVVREQMRLAPVVPIAPADQLLAVQPDRRATVTVVAFGYVERIFSIVYRIEVYLFSVL